MKLLMAIVGPVVLMLWALLREAWLFLLQAWASACVCWVEIMERREEG